MNKEVILTGTYIVNGKERQIAITINPDDEETTIRAVKFIMQCLEKENIEECTTFKHFK